MRVQEQWCFLTFSIVPRLRGSSSLYAVSSAGVGSKKRYKQYQMKQRFSTLEKKIHRSGGLFPFPFSSLCLRLRAFTRFVPFSSITLTVTLLTYSKCSRSYPLGCLFP